MSRQELAEKECRYLEINQIYHGDTQELIKQVEPDSIDLSVWSPPYFVGKNYEKHYTFTTWQLLLNNTINEHFRILKPGGFLAINIGDILAFKDPDMPKIQAPNTTKQRRDVTKEDVLKAKKKHPDFNRYQLAELLNCSEQTIDRRLNGNNIRGGKYSSQTRVYLVGHHLEKYAYEAGLYLYDRRVWVKDPAWQNSKWHSSSYRSVDEFEYIYIFWRPGETIIDRNRLSSEEWAQWGGRGVWNIPSVRHNNSHEAMYPVELPSRIIKLLTKENDTVLDPFIGSGTTALACFHLKRNYLGFDNQKKYVELAKKNVQSEKDKFGYLFS